MSPRQRSIKTESESSELVDELFTKASKLISIGWAGFVQIKFADHPMLFDAALEWKTKVKQPLKFVKDDVNL